jgi:hypothetical protein
MQNDGGGPVKWLRLHGLQSSFTSIGRGAWSQAGEREV